MAFALRFLRRFQERLRGLSIVTRIAIGNSVIIVLGAIGGTTLVHNFTERGTETLSIALFASAGILLSILLNLWIVRAALHPLLALRRFVSKINSGEETQNSLTLKNPDPETHALAASLSSLIEQLEEKNRSLKLLSLRAINAQEEERKRIARSLHDDTGQALSSLIITLDHLDDSLPASQTEVREKLVAARSLCAQTLAELRKIIAGLRPSILDDVGLSAAIKWYAQTCLKESDIDLVFKAPEELPIIPPETSTTLFRIAQEAINNIHRHSQAKQATITLGNTPEEVYLCVEDDGVGFQTSPNQNEAIRREHWGLLGIQERVELVSGSFHILSSPGKGCALQVYLPLDSDNGNHHGQDSHHPG